MELELEHFRRDEEGLRVEEKCLLLLIFFPILLSEFEPNLDMNWSLVHTYRKPKKRLGQWAMLL